MTHCMTPCMNTASGVMQHMDMDMDMDMDICVHMLVAASHPRIRLQPRMRVLAGPAVGVAVPAVVEHQLRVHVLRHTALPRHTRSAGALPRSRPCTRPALALHRHPPCHAAGPAAALHLHRRRMNWLRLRRRCWWLGRGRVYVSANSTRRSSGILTMALLTMAMPRSSDICTACIPHTHTHTQRDDA